MAFSWGELPDITLLVRLSMRGDRNAADRLYQLAYPFLDRIAASLLRRERTPEEITSLDLIHDAYLDRMRVWHGPITERNHYLAIFTNAMKQQLVDRARRYGAQKRNPRQVAGFPLERASALSYEEVIALERELEKLGKDDLQAAQVVRLRYYGGCSWEETAAALGTTVKIARTDWEFASKWLRERLGQRC